MNNYISMSVVIPTYNRTTVLFETIRSLYGGKAVPNEIIVVDQTTPAVMFPEDLKMMESKGLLKVIHEKIPSLTRSRNIGLNSATNNIVLFCDDDILVDENTIWSLYQRMDNNNIALVAGIHKDENILFEGKADKKLKSLFSTIIGLKKFWKKGGYVVRGSMRGRYSTNISKPLKTEWAMGYFFCVKKNICIENQLWFDEKLIKYAYAEDLDFSLRYCTVANKLKMQTIVDPTLYVNHLATKEWRTPSRVASFYTVINRRYLSYKIFPQKFWYRFFIQWSDLCWQYIGCKTKEEKKNWHDARNKCRKNKEYIINGNLMDIYE